MTAAAVRRRPSSRAQLALKSESITTPAKMMMSATTDPTRTLCQRTWRGISQNIDLRPLLIVAFRGRFEARRSLGFCPSMEARPLQTSITLVLEHADPELSRAHRELYPERIAEHIPFSLTLHYPWLPAAEVTDADLARLREFFAARPPLEFELTHVTEFPGVVAYAAPEPDEELRSTMRALWAMYPQCPPYGRPGFDPPPHATLGRYEGPTPITLEQAKERVEPLLPVHCHITEATLQEEYELDRMRVRQTFRLAG